LVHYLVVFFAQDKHGMDKLTLFISELLDTALDLSEGCQCISSW